MHPIGIFLAFEFHGASMVQPRIIWYFDEDGIAHQGRRIRTSVSSNSKEEVTI